MCADFSFRDVKLSSESASLGDWVVSTSFDPSSAWPRWRTKGKMKTISGHLDPYEEATRGSQAWKPVTALQQWVLCEKNNYFKLRLDVFMAYDLDIREFMTDCRFATPFKQEMEHRKKFLFTRGNMDLNEVSDPSFHVNAVHWKELSKSFSQYEPGNKRKYLESMTLLWS